MSSVNRCILCITFALFFGSGLLSSCEKPTEVTPDPKDSTGQNDSTIHNDTTVHNDTTENNDSTIVEPSKTTNWIIVANQSDDSVLIENMSANVSHDNIFLDIEMRGFGGEKCTLSLPKATTLGRHEIDASIKPTKGTFIWQGQAFAMISGTIELTNVDSSNHEFSASFTLEFEAGGGEKITLIGALNNADLFVSGHHNGSMVVSWMGMYPHAIEKVATKQFIITAGANSSVPGCRAVNDYVYYRSEIILPNPEVNRVYSPGVAGANWWVSEKRDVSDPRCGSGYTNSYNARPQDSLVVTVFDPVNRRISGWFTTGHGRATFDIYCWRRIHPPE